MGVDKDHQKKNEFDSFYIRSNANSLCSIFLKKVESILRGAEYHRDWFSGVDIYDVSSITEETICKIYGILEERCPDLKQDREELVKACNYLQTIYESPYYIGSPIWTYDNLVPLNIQNLIQTFIKRMRFIKDDEDDE